MRTNDDDNSYNILNYKDEICKLLKNYKTDKRIRTFIFKQLCRDTFNPSSSTKNRLLTHTTKKYYDTHKSNFHNDKDSIVEYIENGLSLKGIRIKVVNRTYYLAFKIKEIKKSLTAIDYIQDVKLSIKDFQAKEKMYSTHPKKRMSWIDSMEIFYNFKDPLIINEFSSLLKLITDHNIKLTLFCKYDFKDFRKLVNYKSGGKIIITEVDKHFEYFYSLINIKSLKGNEVKDYKHPKSSLKLNSKKVFLIKYINNDKLNVSYQENYSNGSKQHILKGFIDHHQNRIAQVLNTCNTDRLTAVFTQEIADDNVAFGNSLFKDISYPKLAKVINNFALEDIKDLEDLKIERNKLLVNCNYLYVIQDTESTLFQSIVWIIYSIKRAELLGEDQKSILKESFILMEGSHHILDILGKIKTYFGYKSPLEYIKDIDIDPIMMKIHTKRDRKEAFSTKFKELNFPASEKEILESFKKVASSSKLRTMLGEFLEEEISDERMAIDGIVKYFSLRYLSTE